MKYKRIAAAKFIERENRFVARVQLASVIRVHVKNTGRCRELLVPGATVLLEDHLEEQHDGHIERPQPGKKSTRKYRYSLIAVRKETDKGPILINMDSQAPNKVVGEALRTGRLILSGFDEEGYHRTSPLAAEDLESMEPAVPAEFAEPAELKIYPERSFGSSRFDFYLEWQKKSGQAEESGEAPAYRRAFVEVKGVTLEDGGVARFPDAPTQRGLKHVKELEQALTEGYEAYIIFVIQMKGMKRFEPNDETHPEFGEALRHAKATGVRILAYDCIVTEDGLRLDQPVPVKL